MTPAGDDGVGDWRLKLYVNGGAVTLSRALPVLQNLGAEVLDERPFEVRLSDGSLSRIYDFGLRFPQEQVSKGAGRPELRSRFTDAFVAAWSGASEIDGFNQLVLAAGLNWREVAVLRSYAHYLRQIGTPYTQRYVEQVLERAPAADHRSGSAVRHPVRPGLAVRGPTGDATPNARRRPTTWPRTSPWRWTR